MSSVVTISENISPAFFPTEHLCAWLNSGHLGIILEYMCLAFKLLLKRGDSF